MSDYSRDEADEEDESTTFDIRAFRRNRPAPDADKVVKKAIEVLTNGVPKEDAKVANLHHTAPAWLLFQAA
jgi:hypothetical protein